MVFEFTCYERIWKYELKNVKDQSSACCLEILLDRTVSEVCEDISEDLTDFVPI